VAIKPSELKELSKDNEHQADMLEMEIDKKVKWFVEIHGDSNIIKISLGISNDRPNLQVEKELKARYEKAGWRAVEFKHDYEKGDDVSYGGCWHNDLALIK